ncbi:MAG: aminotransferase class V-fold PLP-dependent enzyme [Pseudomonadota bacterium]
MTLTTTEVERLRAETRGVANCVHLNNAGAGLMPQPVIDAVCAHVRLEADIGGYEAAAREEARCADVYAQVAALIGAQPREIALLENATVAWQLAFYAQKLGPGDRILTARAEYAANYVAFLQQAERTGCVIEVIPDGPDGATDPVALQDMIDDRVRLIAITHIPTNGGLVNPAAEIGAIANRRGIPYLLDACQTVGQMPVDVDELGCDFLSATGRKFLRGPRGTGFLYVREKWLDTIEPPMIDHFGAEWTAADAYTLRADARRFETWENSYALRLGLGVAAEYASNIGLDAIQERAFGLASDLRAELSAIPGVEVKDIGSQRCAIVTFAADQADAATIKVAMSEAGVNVSTSSPASTRLDAEARGLPIVVRVSPHYYNTETEIERFLSKLKSVLG